MSTTNCIFCDILAGRLPSSQVYRDELCTALMDIQPVNPGHMDIVPNIHSAFLSELDEETGAQMFRIAQRLARALRRSDVKCEGVNFFLADGKAAMQEIFHVHLHVFPRFDGDGFGLTFGPTYFHKPARNELDEIAQKIRSALD
jgi:histidine triad (HIT) family protein